MERLNFLFKSLSFSVIVFAIMPVCGTSQNYIPYYNFRNEAVYAFKKEEYASADSLLGMAFLCEEPFGKDIYLRALVKSYLGQKEEVIKFLKMSFMNSRQGASKFHIDRDSSIFRKVLSRESFDMLRDTLVILADHNIFYVSNLDNLALNIEKTEAFIERDQEFRSKFEGELTENIQMERKMADKILHKDLIDYVSIHGWPFHASELLTTILTHFDEPDFMKCDSLLLNQVKIGRLDPFWYARAKDRIHSILHPDTCLYGIWDTSCRDSQTLQNRLSIGLSPFWNGVYRIFTKMEVNDDFNIYSQE